MKEKRSTYTAPAVIGSTDAVQSTKAVIFEPTDGERTGNEQAPGSVGFSL